MSTPDIISTVAAVIALCALFATAWQAYIAREHNRLSVRPALVLHRANVVTNDGTEISFSVRNCGIGPAIVRERLFHVEGKRFLPSTQPNDQVQCLCEAVLGGKIEYLLREHGLPGEGAPIPPNGEHIVARIFFQGVQPPLIDSLLQSIPEVTFHIHYESLYKERFVLNVI